MGDTDRLEGEIDEELAHVAVSTDPDATDERRRAVQTRLRRLRNAVEALRSTTR